MRRPNSSLITQLAASLASRAAAVGTFDHGLEEVGALALGHQHAGVVAASPKSAMKRAFFSSGSSGKRACSAVDIGLGELQRQQVGIGEIAVVVRLFLGAHRAGLVAAGSNSRVSCSIAPPSSRISIWRRASYSIACPTKRIEFTFLISQRVPSGSPGLAHRDVDVGAQGALLHVAVAGAEIAQDGAQLGEIGLGLLGGAHVRLRHDLHQRDAGAVEIDERHGRMLVVQRLAGVLLQMQPLDADPDGRRPACRPRPRPRRRSGDLYWLI